MECGICTSVKKSVMTCPYCQYVSCLACNERVILESINAPACVNCKKTFSNDFLYSTFSKVFLNKRYAQHREQILYEREKFLLPATQPIAEREKKRLEISDKLLQIRREMNEIRTRLRLMRLQEGRYKHRLHLLELQQDEEKKDNVPQAYIGACPVRECRGFLTSECKCGMCGVRVCEKCREPLEPSKPSESDDKKNEEEEKKHECNPDTVATVQEIARSTRACPSCRVPIFRIEGCDQMWCVKCNVAFNWRTGQIERGIIHNPHYYEFIRANGGAVPRNPHEERNGGMPPASFLAAIDGKMDDESKQSCGDCVTRIYRTINHIRQVLLPRLPTPIDNVTHQDLRVDFLLQRITEDEFKTKLQRREKERNKKLEQRTILQTYCDVVQDLLNNFYDNGREMQFTARGERVVWSRARAMECIHEERQIKQYSEEAWRKMNANFSSNVAFPL